MCFAALTAVKPLIFRLKLFHTGSKENEAYATGDYWS